MGGTRLGGLPGRHLCVHVDATRGQCRMGVFEELRGRPARRWNRERQVSQPAQTAVHVVTDRALQRQAPSSAVPEAERPVGFWGRGPPSRLRRRPPRRVPRGDSGHLSDGSVNTLTPSHGSHTPDLSSPLVTSRRPHLMPLQRSLGFNTGIWGDTDTDSAARGWTGGLGPPMQAPAYLPWRLGVARVIGEESRTRWVRLSVANEQQQSWDQTGRRGS